MLRDIVKRNNIRDVDLLQRFMLYVMHHLAPYAHVLIIGVKTTNFEVTRRRFGDILKGISEIKENEAIDVLIAGNCYHCEVCTKTIGEACILKEGTKYSLEALGFHVGDICEHILDAPLDWSGSYVV